jgi:hypothetical protein
VSHIWEDVNDIEVLGDPFCWLDGNSICGDSIGNYVVEFASNALQYIFFKEEEVPSLCAHLIENASL